MIIKELTVTKAEGFGNSDAERIVKTTMKFDSDVFFEYSTRKINAKSLMGVISMGLKKGDKIMVIVNGPDQDEALTEIMNVFNN